MKSFFESTALVGLGVAFAASSAMGAFTFNDGDLLLGFQATSGTGSTKNVFFNIGSGVYHRNNPGYAWAPDVRGNISTTLSSVYGANWFNRADIHFGVIGNLSTTTSGSPVFTPAVAGDPSRTLYVSTPAATVGSGALYEANTYVPSALGSIGNKFAGTETMVTTLITEADGAAILDKDTQAVQWNNGWSVWNPVPGPAYDTLTGGIQQTLGQGTPALVDIQRVLATNTGANPTGVVGGGTYETTLRISSDGTIAMIPEPSSSLLAGLAGLALVIRRRRA